MPEWGINIRDGSSQSNQYHPQNPIFPGSEPGAIPPCLETPPASPSQSTLQDNILFDDNGGNTQAIADSLLLETSPTSLSMPPPARPSKGHRTTSNARGRESRTRTPQREATAAGPSTGGIDARSRPSATTLPETHRAVTFTDAEPRVRIPTGQSKTRRNLKRLCATFGCARELTPEGLVKARHLRYRVNSRDFGYCAHCGEMEARAAQGERWDCANLGCWYKRMPGGETCLTCAVERFCEAATDG